MKRVLVVDDEENLRVVLKTLLRRHGYEVEVASGGQEALVKIDSFGPDVVLTDVRMPKLGGLDLLSILRAKGNPATVIVMSAYGNVDQAIEAMKAGAYDYLQKPFKPDEVVLALRKAEERELLRRENTALREEIRKEHRFEDILAKSAAMQNIFRTIGKIAEYKTTVLISGESGVGKELVAKALHAQSRRSGRFVAVNCGAIPENLLESELFGHKRGAFTDAVADRRGLFEEATGGTLFLDEVGELPLALQVKLLRVLQEREVRRLGSTESIPVNVRIVTATNAPIEQLVKDGGFRSDLLYRLNTFEIRVPPLRQRVEDIQALVEFFLRKHGARYGIEPQYPGAEVLQQLKEYPWPGNVRELENFVVRWISLGAEALDALDKREALRFESQDVNRRWLSMSMAEIEAEVIKMVLHDCAGNKTLAAKRLGVARKSLYNKIERYKLEL